MADVVFNKLLGAWYVVTGEHQTPISGAFDTKAQAIHWMNRRRNSALHYHARGAIEQLHAERKARGWEA